MANEFLLDVEKYYAKMRAEDERTRKINGDTVNPPSKPIQLADVFPTFHGALNMRNNYPAPPSKLNTPGKIDKLNTPKKIDKPVYIESQGAIECPEPIDPLLVAERKMNRELWERNQRLMQMLKEETKKSAKSEQLFHRAMATIQRMKNP